MDGIQQICFTGAVITDNPNNPVFKLKDPAAVIFKLGE
jgi:hypothetical protein